jgi:hypothetical protein
LQGVERVSEAIEAVKAKLLEHKGNINVKVSVSTVPWGEAAA